MPPTIFVNASIGSPLTLQCNEYNDYHRYWFYAWVFGSKIVHETDEHYILNRENITINKMNGETNIACYGAYLAGNMYGTSHEHDHLLDFVIVYSNFIFHYFSFFLNDFFFF